MAATCSSRRYVYGPGVDEPIVWYEGTGTTDRRFMSADERGSIISVSDGSGNVLGINKYDEFGQPQGPSGAGTLYGKFGYTGQAWVPEIGEYYYKARAYDPELGRFMQPDPIGYEAGPNLYAYVRNDPVNLVDPLGLDEGIVVIGSCLPGWSCFYPSKDAFPTLFKTDGGGNITHQIVTAKRRKRRGGGRAYGGKPANTA